MQIKLSKEANTYLNATILRIIETNKVNRELCRKLTKLAGRFNPDSDTVNLKQNDAESVKGLLENMIVICDEILANTNSKPEIKELATKRKEIFNEVNNRITTTIKTNTR